MTKLPMPLILEQNAASLEKSPPGVHKHKRLNLGVLHESPYGYWAKDSAYQEFLPVAMDPVRHFPKMPLNLWQGKVLLSRKLNFLRELQFRNLLLPL